MATALSVLGTPGQAQSFSPKTPATGGKPNDQLIQLSVTATPGRVLQFSPKAPEAGGKPSDQITALQVTALPGKLFNFTPKDAAPVSEVIHPTGGEPLFKTEEEEVILTIINSFLFMRDQDGRD